MRPIQVIFLLPFLTIFFGCSSDTMPSYSIIQGLRVLGLQIDLPEIGFNAATSSFSVASVNLTPVLSDLYGGGRSLTYRLYHCMDPGIGIGATPSCSGNPTLTQVTTGTLITAPNLEFQTPNYTGALSPISIPLNTLSPAVLALYSSKFSSLTPAQVFNGYSMLIFFELFPTTDESKKITTFKRLVLSGSSKTVKNQNPTSLDFQQNQVHLSALPLTESSVNAYVPPASFETYSLMKSDGSLTTETETIETAWFLTGPSDIECSNKKECTSDGLFALARSVPGELNLFSPPKASLPVGRARILIGVAKDNRGGVTVTRLCDGALCP